MSSSVFVPGFAILSEALAITLLYGFFNMMRNLIQGHTGFPQMLIGTRMSLEKAKRSTVWPMADIVNGEVVDTIMANEGDDIWKKLEDHGVQEIWVTAIIPFIIPITVAFFIVVTLGFPLFIL
jgi:prepilin signal peptidase PulO-like enzyme (type II secretory pathway)